MTIKRSLTRFEVDCYTHFTRLSLGRGAWGVGWLLGGGGRTLCRGSSLAPAAVALFGLVWAVAARCVGAPASLPPRLSCSVLCGRWPCVVSSRLQSLPRVRWCRVVVTTRFVGAHGESTFFSHSYPDVPCRLTAAMRGRHVIEPTILVSNALILRSILC